MGIVFGDAETVEIGAEPDGDRVDGANAAVEFSCDGAIALLLFAVLGSEFFIQYKLAFKSEAAIFFKFAERTSPIFGIELVAPFLETAREEATEAMRNE